MKILWNIMYMDGGQGWERDCVVQFVDNITFPFLRVNNHGG